MKRRIRFSQIIKKEELMIGLLILVFVFLLDYNCLFKSVFHLPCAGCGITRGFEALMKFNVNESFRYNLLALPIVMYVLFLLTLRLIDAFRGTHKALALEKPVMTPKRVMLVVALVGFSWSLNVIRGL